MRVRFRAEFAEMRSAPKYLRVYVLVTIAKTSELLLASGIPHVEADGAEVGVEGERVDLNAKGGCRQEEEELEGRAIDIERAKMKDDAR